MQALVNPRYRKASVAAVAFGAPEAFLGLVSVNILGARVKEPFTLRAVHDEQEVLRSAVVHSDKETFLETVLWMLAPKTTGLRIEARAARGLLGALVLECDVATVDGATLKKWCPLFHSGAVVGELLISVVFRISQEGREKLALKVESDARSLLARRAVILQRAVIAKEEIAACILQVKAVEDSIHDGGYSTPSLTVKKLHKAARGGAKEEAALFRENNRFQLLLDDIAASVNGGHEKLVPLYEEVHTISQDFVEMAKFYGHIIISELHLPVERKTIKPWEGSGGVLGGQKFLVHNILFKCPDAKVFAEYPDALWASMKVAGHELKGMQCLASYFLDKGSVGAHLPLTALIDSRGHRLLATSVLPISNATLVYGSDNAAFDCNVAHSDPTLRVIVTEACLQLGLKMHSVVNGYSPDSRTQVGEVDIASPIDLEGHKGLDGRYYLVDCSRLMPPMCRAETAFHDKYWPYYSAMRPEFVTSYAESLNPDAFSQFCSRLTKERIEQMVEDQKTIRAASLYFREVHLPLVAKSILEYWVTGGRDVMSFSLRTKLHKSGVNMRFLGDMIAVMREKFTDSELEESEELIKLYECEALARAGKNFIRSRLRDVHSQRFSLGSSHLVQEVVCFVNEFVGIVNVTEWMGKNRSIVLLLTSMFGFSSENLEKAVATFLGGEMLRSHEPKIAARAFTLERLCEMTGIGIVPEVMDALCQGRMGFAGATISLAAPDVTFSCRVKNLSVVDHAAGFVLFHQGLAALDQVTKVSYYKRAQLKLVAALNSSPLDSRALTLAGDINLKHMAVENDTAMAKQLGVRAEDYFTASMCIDPLSGATRRSYAELKMLQRDFPAAEELFLQALELNDMDQEALRMYGHFLRNSLHDDVEADAIYKRLDACDKL